MAPDGKIYVAKFKRGAAIPKDNPGVIYNPDRPGALCNYNHFNHADDNGLYLEGGGSLIGLPTFVSSFLDIPHFYPVGICDKDTTRFTIRNTANIDQTEWDFGDPQGNLAINNPLTPEFIYHEPGVYQVDYTERIGNTQYDFQKMVTIHELPKVQIAEADTIFAEPGSTVVLDAGDWDLYNWQPGGSTQRTLEVTTTGYYSVTVTDSNCCRNTDQVLVRFFTKVNETSQLSEKLEIFPNPAINELNIRIQKYEGSMSLAIIGIDGQLCLQEYIVGKGNPGVERKLDISSIPSGVYLLQIGNEQEHYSTKLIIQ